MARRTVIVPRAYLGDGGGNPILMRWTQVISAAALTDPGLCAEDAPIPSADAQPLSRLNVRVRHQ